MRVRNLAQAIVEYVLFFSIVAVALAAMQVYGKRGLSAVMKKTADSIIEPGITHADNKMTLNDTEKTWFKAYGETTLGGNNTVQSAEKEDIAGSKYRNTKVTRIKTGFSGKMLGDMAEEKE